MDDYSFFGAGRGGSGSASNQQQQPQQQQQQQRSPVIAIPRLSEVQAAQQPSSGAPLNSLFRPRGLVSAYNQQQQQRQHGTSNQGSMQGAGTSAPQQQGPPAHSGVAWQPQGSGGGGGGGAPAWQAGTTSQALQGPPLPAGGQQQQFQTHQQHQQYPHQQQPQQNWQQPQQVQQPQQPQQPQQVQQPQQPQQPQQVQQPQQPQQPQHNQYQPQQQQHNQNQIAYTGPPPGGGGVASGNAIVVSRRQQGNPVLKHIKSVRWVFGDIGPDYLLGANACALYLSLRYHLLHPNYILYRIKELQRSWGLRVVLVHVDVEDVVQPLADITKTAALNDCTLICAWSAEEAARYLETFKAYENKPAAGIQERVDGDYASRLASTLIAVRAVNRTDSLALGAQLGTLAAVMTATQQQLSACPGVGPTKVHNLWDAFNKPFRRQGGTGGAGAGPAGAHQVAQGGHDGQAGVAADGPMQVAGAAGAVAGGAGALAGAPGAAAVQAPGSMAGAQGQGPAALAAAGGHAGKRARIDSTAGTPHGKGASGRPAGSLTYGHDEAEEVVEDDQGGAWREEDGEEGEEDGDGDNEGGEVQEEGGLVYMASQIMLQVQAGAMAATAMDSGEGSEDQEDHDVEEL